MENPAPIALQLYSLREQLQEDFAGTVTKVAELGYIGVEPYGGLPAPPEEAAKRFTDLNLTVESIHLPAPVGDDKNKSLETAAIFGVKYLVVPSLPREEFTTEDGIKRMADTLNQAHENATAQGFILGYHNHDFEFVQVNGKPAYQTLLDLINPAIQLQVDTYWVQVGGHDTVALIAQLGDRARLLHIKDGPATRGQAMTAVGTGVMDIPAIVEAAKPHVEWLIVELDHCDTDMVEAVTQSYHYMTSEGLAKGLANGR